MPAKRKGQQDVLDWEIDKTQFWTELCPSQNLYVEALIPSTSAWDCIGDRVFKEIIKLKWRPCQWVLLQSDWCLNKKRRRGHMWDSRDASTQRKCHVRMQREGGCWHTKERGLRRSRAHWQPVLGFPASLPVRNLPQSVVFYHGSPSKLIPRNTTQKRVDTHTSYPALIHGQWIYPFLFLSPLIYVNFHPGIRSPQGPIRRKKPHNNLNTKSFP